MFVVDSHKSDNLCSKLRSITAYVLLPRETRETEFGLLTLPDKSYRQQFRGLHDGQRFTIRKVPVGGFEKPPQTSSLGFDKIPCVLHANGICKEGQKCQFSHDESIANKIALSPPSLSDDGRICELISCQVPRRYGQGGPVY